MRRCAALLAGGMLAALAFSQDEGRIMAPVDRASFAGGPIRVLALAPVGKLLLDGKEIPAEQPFPNILQTSVSSGPGEHILRLIWEGGRQEVRFHVGPNPPPEYSPYREHPPIATECTHCHGLSRRGRFRFSGGCFSCHRQETFSAKHTHPPGQLEQCGMCHNAHGSTAAALLLHPKETACKLCHN